MKYINKNFSKYKDMLNLPHHVSEKHPHMSVYSRAAQFSPFAALTGYEKRISESSRYTSAKELIDEQAVCIIDSALRFIKQNIKAKPALCIEYFMPDAKKDGGEYISVNGHADKINESSHTLILTDALEIPICDIKKIEIL